MLSTPTAPITEAQNTALRNGLTAQSLLGSETQMTIELTLHELMLIHRVLTEMNDMTVKEMTPEAIGRLSARAFMASLPISRLLNKRVTLEVTNA